MSASATSADANSLSMVGLLVGGITTSTPLAPLRVPRTSRRLIAVETTWTVASSSQPPQPRSRSRVVPPAFARRRGGTALALVTADLEAAIVAVDLSNGEIHARLNTPAGPRSIESIGERAALVAHTEAREAHPGRLPAARPPDRR